ncbi:MAG: polyhydroxyalkanoate synthesis repressor PhaR [Kangiellaceae bacterium]|nr:polyhydroxyalkanoate synthesis repressor PhaR [Kangiellaceae bacterium]
MSDIRIIKKYPNRRLYDTTISKYITLNDVRELVTNYTDFKVVDAKSNEDLTRCTLLQIIAEQEESEHPIFTPEILQHAIRFYGDSMQAMMSKFLEHSMKLFIEQQGGFKNPLNTFLGTNPMTMMQNIAEQNMSMWKSMDDDFYSKDSEEEERVSE